MNDSERIIIVINIGFKNSDLLSGFICFRPHNPNDNIHGVFKNEPIAMHLISPILLRIDVEKKAPTIIAKYSDAIAQKPSLPKPSYTKNVY